MTFVFYDTETTGLSPAYDQILQFAGLVTDPDFNITDQVDQRCRPWPHILPSPGALVITGIRLSDAMDAALSFYELAGKLAQLIEQHSPCTFIGFNSLSYDENMLRNAFYQTLHPIYATNMNGNSRMDVLRLAHAVHEHQPGVINVPRNEKGNLSFKLELLAKANDLLHDSAHDAMSDTRATLLLAKLIRDQAPGIWNALYGTRTKAQTLEVLTKNTVVLQTDRMFSKPTIPATMITQNPDYDSEVAIFDLTHDPEHYFGLGQDEAPKLLKGKDRAIRIIKSNANPILVPMEDTRAPRSEDWPDDQTLMERAERIRNNTSFSRSVAIAISSRFEERDPPERIEERIYDGFYSWPDQKLMAKFHKAPWAERTDICKQFDDPRLFELGMRLICLESPSDLQDDIGKELDHSFRERLFDDGDVSWQTTHSVQDEIHQLRQDQTDRDKAILDDYEACFRQHISRFTGGHSSDIN